MAGRTTVSTILIFDKTGKKNHPELKVKISIIFWVDDTFLCEKDPTKPRIVSEGIAHRGTFHASY